MSTTSLTSLRTFIKSLHGWTLNIEKAQSSINGMNVSMHNYLEYTILLNFPKISHISFHWFKHVRLYALSELNFGSYLSFESIFKSCKPIHVCFYRKEVLTFDLLSFGDVCLRFDSSYENFGTQFMSFWHSMLNSPFDFSFKY